VLDDTIIYAKSFIMQKSILMLRITFLSRCFGMLLVLSFVSVCFANNIYVGNYADNSISVIDANKNKVITTVPVSPGPANMVLSDAAHSLYVVDSATYTVSLLDTQLNKVTKQIEVGKIPRGMALSNDGKLIIVGIAGTHSRAQQRHYPPRHQAG